MPAGRLFMAAFFLALFFAAMTSLISMVQAQGRVLVDRGMARGKAIGWVTVAALALGVPGALSMGFFENQDNVWGVGLLVGGLFFGIAVLKFGVDRFRTRFVNGEGATSRSDAGGDAAVWLVVGEALVLLVWWLSQTLSQEGWAEASTRSFRGASERSSSSSRSFSSSVSRSTVGSPASQA